MVKKRHLFLFALLVFLMIFVFTSRGYIGSLVHPLPFEGPYNGTIIDALSGNPIKSTRVMADWWCYDSPDPHFGNYWVHIFVTSDENGRYEIKKPRRRAGWFGGSFTLSVNAKGYIPVVVVIRDEPLLPPSTKTYPFQDTRAYTSLSESMDIRLNPFKPVLLEALKSENTQHRWMAANELGKIGKEAVYAVEPLIYSLKDQDATVRKYAIDALGGIGAAAKSAAPTLIAALNDEGEWVRLAAIDALGSIGYADDDIVTALIKLLNDKDSWSKDHAVTSLGKLGPGAKAAVPVLKDMLNRQWINKYLRREIEYTLKKIDPDALDDVSFK